MQLTKVQGMNPQDKPADNALPARRSYTIADYRALPPTEWLVYNGLELTVEEKNNEQF